jgi:hypothetical protein
MTKSTIKKIKEKRDCNMNRNNQLYKKEENMR